MSSIHDPRDFPITPEGQLSERITKLEALVAQLGSTPSASVGSAVPTADVPDGWFYVQRATPPVLWCRVNGFWAKVNLTAPGGYSDDPEVGFGGSTGYLT